MTKPPSARPGTPTLIGHAKLGDELAQTRDGVVTVQDSHAQTLTKVSRQARTPRLANSAGTSECGGTGSAGSTSSVAIATSFEVSLVSPGNTARSPDLPSRDLHPSAPSSWLRAGVPINQVSQWLGHANPNTTLKVYAHVLGEAQDLAAIDRLNAAEQTRSRNAAAEWEAISAAPARDDDTGRSLN